MFRNAKSEDLNLTIRAIGWSVYQAGVWYVYRAYSSHTSCVRASQLEIGDCLLVGAYRKVAMHN